MTDDDPFGEDFGSLEELLKGLKPGAPRPLSGILRYRMGSDPQEWDSPGQQKYIPGAWQMMAGAIRWTGASATSGSLSFNFPVAFSYEPLLFVSAVVTFPLFKNITCYATPSGSGGMEIYWWCPDALTIAGFNWWAMGPVGP